MANAEKTKKPTLVGTWVNGDEYGTDVQYQVSRKTQGLAVRAVDRFDGERAQAYDVKWDGEVLAFATHWPSTGRFVKCQLLASLPIVWTSPTHICTKKCGIAKGPLLH